MPELNLDLDYFEHPKVMLLAEALGEWAEILPIKLWRFTAKFHPSTGVITGPSVTLIERHLNWRGKKGEGIKALVTFGFLKEIPGGYEVHDFLEHQGHIESYKIRGKAGAKAKWAKRARDATSIAASNGASIDTSNAQTDGRTNGRTDERTDGTKFGWLAREWLHYHRGAESEPDRQSAANFEDLVAAGVNAEAIVAEIKRKDRKKTETIWEFCKRIQIEANHNRKLTTDDDLKNLGQYKNGQ